MLSSTTISNDRSSSNDTDMNRQKTIKQAVLDCEQHFSERACPAPDSPATAKVLGGLCCQVTNPSGVGTIYTDMPAAIGGGITRQVNSPGWHLRAAVASCDATMMAIRAARLDIALRSIEVTVSGSSDGRGMLDVATENGNDVSAGSTEFLVYYKIGIQGTDTTPQQVKDLVQWVEQHSPVASDVKEGVKDVFQSKIDLV